MQRGLFSLTYRYYSQDGMWVLFGIHGSPSIKVVHNEGKASYCQGPCDPHEEAVELVVRKKRELILLLL